MLDVNEYFEGKVKSIAFQSRTLPATIGVMNVGNYTFGTDCKEIMEVVSGELNVKLPDADDWQVFVEGQVFEVEANQSFDLEVKVPTAYLCQYIR
ncbi:MAG: pyrimidine/purine nucleoside phosphorylase [Agarilytica sp.]